MTKQELVEMTGNEEQAQYVWELVLKHYWEKLMEIALNNCKKVYVERAIKMELDEIVSQIETLRQEGIILTHNGTDCVDWSVPNEPFKKTLCWDVTDEQITQSAELGTKCVEAENLLYRRNRVIPLLRMRRQKT